MAAFQQGTIHIKQRGTISNSDAGWLRVYANPDGSLHVKNETGADYRLINSTEVSNISGQLFQLATITPSIFSTTTSLSATYDYVVYTGTTSGNIFYLPPANSLSPNAVVLTIKHGAKSYYKLNISPYQNGTDSIEGGSVGSTIQMVSGQSFMLISDGISNYYIN